MVNNLPHFLLCISTKRLVMRKGAKMVVFHNVGIDFLEFRPSEIAAGVAIYVVGQTQMCALFQHVQKVMIIKCLDFFFTFFACFVFLLHVLP